MWVYWYIVRFTGERPFRENALDVVRSYAMGVRKSEFRLTSRTYLPKRWFDANLSHTHVALDDALEQGAVLQHVRGKPETAGAECHAPPRQCCSDSAGAGAAGGVRRRGRASEINQPYHNPDFQEWVERFFRAARREVYDRRHAIVEAVGLWRGAAVADIGAGTGLFTRLFARAVGPEGKVYAVDISREFVRNIQRLARAEGFTNVAGVVNTQTRRAPAAGFH